MFFENYNVKKRSARLKEPPPIVSDWRPPDYFPELRGASVIALDVETYDPALPDYGPGWSRGPAGYICGVAIAALAPTGELGSWYFPTRHIVGTEYNLDENKVFAWLREQLDTPNIPKCGANLIYDIGWLSEYNINVRGELIDVQFAEALIDETAYVELDTLANKYLRQSKQYTELYRWIAEAYGGNANSDQRKNIYRAPPQLVGPYGEADAYLPILIYQEQYKRLLAEDLMPVFKMECGLIPLLIKMRKQGVNIDSDKAKLLKNKLMSEVSEHYAELSALTGVKATRVDSHALPILFRAMGMEFPKSETTGNATFRKEWLTSVADKNPLAKLVLTIREKEKLCSTFLQGYFLDSAVNGVIHCQFHPLKGDNNGAKTGRFASSDPNLQNIPARSKLGKELRKLIIPHRGHKRIRKRDYSQIEYRMLANFAVDAGDGSAERLRASYVNDPKTDYHVNVQQEIKRLTDILIDRKPIKNINFGLLYGQTEKSLAYKAGFDETQAANIFKAYHTGAPYVKATMKHIMAQTQALGYVTTLLNRRTRFNEWVSADFNERGLILPLDEALARFGAHIKLYKAYRAVNYKFQGSAAEVIKTAMLRAYNDGVFDFIGYPILQVHDELVFSEIEESQAQEEAYKYLTHVMENAIKDYAEVRIPIAIDEDIGPNWGDFPD